MSDLDSEVLFRQAAEKVFGKIQQVLQYEDPDQVEAEAGMGGLVLIFQGKDKCILSLQPAIQQLWVAWATQGIAYHFAWEREGQEWRDCRHPEIHLETVLKNLLEQQLHKTVPLSLKES